MFTDCVRSSLFALSAIQDCAVVSLPKVGTVAGELSRTATPLCRLVTQHAGRRAPMNLRIPLFATYKHIVGRYSRVDVGTAIGLLGWASKGGQFTVRIPVEPPARLGAELQVLDGNGFDHADDPASSQPVGATMHRLIITPDRVIDTTRRIGVALRWLLAFEGRLEPSARWNLDLGCSPVVEVELGARIRLSRGPMRCARRNIVPHAVRSVLLSQPTLRCQTTRYAITSGRSFCPLSFSARRRTMRDLEEMREPQYVRVPVRGAVVVAADEVSPTWRLSRRRRAGRS
jgi:hypothetical protein